MIRKTIVYTILVLTLLVAACTPTEPAISPTDPPPATDVPTEPDGSGQTVDENGQHVYIDSLEAMIMESFPVQVSVVVRGNLANPCVIFDGFTSRRDGNVFVFDYSASLDPDAICAAVLQPFEESVTLDVLGLSAGEYVVRAGDVETTFTLDMDNVFEPEPDEGANAGEPTPPVVLPIDNTAWRFLWGEVDGVTFAPFGDRPITLEFKEGELGGNAGCNSYFSDYTLAGETLTIGLVGSTMMACDEATMNLEQQFLSALATAVFYTLSPDQLVLHLPNGSLNFLTNQIVEKTLFVGAEQVDCVGVGPQKCLLVKDSAEKGYEYFYDSIDGFEWQPGFEYELRVRLTPVPNPPADGSSIAYELISIVNQTPID